MEIRPIAHVKSDFNSKFGIPRQSGVVDGLVSYVVFEPEFRSPEALRGIEGFDYIWLIWEFSANRKGGWRSPYRPNPLGLSSVKLDAVLDTPDGPVLRILGADLMDGTPVYDIKPYIDADVHTGARHGFASGDWERALEVRFPPELLAKLPEDKRGACIGVLSQDPRPAYQHDAQRVYGLGFAGFDVRFTVDGGVLTVAAVEPADNTGEHN